MSETKVYPRIWDSAGECKIIGETRVSWLVDWPVYAWSPPIKVSKKNPNKDKFYPTWFFSESDRTERLYVIMNGRLIIKKLASSFPNGITADQLRQIAAIIGYEVKV